MTTLVAPENLIGQRLRVHFNLHTHLWSITAMSGPNAGRVIANVVDITLTGVEFKVSAKGRERSHRLGKRTVHAWVVGVVEAVNTSPDLAGMERVTYNPSPDRAGTFTRTSDGAEISYAARTVFACPPDNPTRGYGWI